MMDRSSGGTQAVQRLVFARPCVMLLCLLALVMLGCTARPPARADHADHDPARRVEPIGATDACAMRLHDLSGAMLLYYLANEDLPRELADLPPPPGQEALALACPVSNRPYVYVPHGIFMPQRNTRVVLHDPLPSHAGMRWAVTIEEPQPGAPLVTEVILLPESFFLLTRPAS
jgi:hypothetical protein